VTRTVSPPTWRIEEPTWQPERNQVWESLMTVANGYLGLRGFPEEPFKAGSTCPGVYVAGVFDPADDGIPELVNVSNLLSVEVELAGAALEMAPGRVSEYGRVLDLRRGLLRRFFCFTTDGRHAEVRFERFASLSNPHLVGQSVTLVPLNWSGQVTVRFWIDTRVRNQHGSHIRLLHAQHMARDRLLLVTETRTSRIRVGHAFRARSWIRQAAPSKAEHLSKEGRMGLAFTAHLECGQRAVFERLVSTHTSRDPAVVSVERDCLADLRGQEGAAYQVHRRRHVQAWRRRWRRCDVEIDGPADDQRAVRFAVFHLIQSAPQRDPTVSIAAKGLSGEGYRGHVFWDTEVFMLPFFTRCMPVTARRLLEYRCHTLPGARRNAKKAGFRGARFAWESADCGEETCPAHVPDPKTGEPVRVLTGEMEDHITADVIYGADQYARVAANGTFHRTRLLEMAVEAARFWASRVAFDDTKQLFVIRRVIGPDEYHEEVDNNAFTNYVASWTLALAADLATWVRAARPRSSILRRLHVSADEQTIWRDVADRMFLPIYHDCGLIEQHEGFFKLEDADPKPLSATVSAEPEKTRMREIHRAQVLKQADVIMLLVMFPRHFSQRVKRRNWGYYEPRTTHDSSLSPSVHCIAACDLGRREKAYRYFHRAARVDLEDRMGNTAIGLHCAALGGTWQAVVRGFLGLSDAGERPTLRPRLPKAWKRVALNVRHKKAWYRIAADRCGVRVTPLGPEGRRKASEHGMHPRPVDRTPHDPLRGTGTLGAGATQQAVSQEVHRRRLRAAPREDPEREGE
jgi:trehalose/maltose hydrolase-like predicted phosphorylase